MIILSVCLFVLAAPGLGCGTRDLGCGVWDLFFSCGMWTNFLVVTCEHLVVACVQDLVPWQGWCPGPLHWEHGVLPTGPPGKSLYSHFKNVGIGTQSANPKKKKKMLIKHLLSIRYHTRSKRYSRKQGSDPCSP